MIPAVNCRSRRDVSCIAIRVASICTLIDPLPHAPLKINTKCVTPFYIFSLLPWPPFTGTSFFLFCSLKTFTTILKPVT